jgi:hypothetical protein
LHTPLVWQKTIPNRTAMAIYHIEGGLQKPKPTILSCVTGTASYDENNSRDLLIQWVDHPQRLWDVIYEALGSGIDLVVHVGPGPNLVPATFERLSNNVLKQMGNRYVYQNVLGGGDCWIITVNPRHSSFYQNVLGLSVGGRRASRHWLPQFAHVPEYRRSIGIRQQYQSPGLTIDGRAGDLPSVLRCMCRVSEGRNVELPCSSSRTTGAI